MSIWSSLYTSSSGLNSFGRALGVVGDNIANVGTNGYKGARASFDALLGGSPGNGRVGSGVGMNGADVAFGQGSLQQTGRSTDLAIWGRGFFVVQGNSNGVEGDWYSRDGRFGFDENSNLVNSAGLRLQGYMIDPTTGQPSANLGSLQIPRLGTPRASTEANLALNLNASEAVATPGTANFSTNMTVYDSLGTARQVTINFEKTGDNQWDWYTTVDGADVAGGVAGTPFEIGRGTVSFNADGSFAAQTGTITADFAGATPGQTITLDLANSTQHAGAGLDVRASEQDGYPAGAYQDLAVAEDGTVSVLYSNGQSREVARLAVAMFSAEGALARAGDQLFAATPGSGPAAVSMAGVGGRGSIAAGALEGSNVDLGNELVTMITYQRAFQANARAVTTADEMLSETANLKR